MSVVGIIALGSHEERHGAALPPDTDAKVAEYIARETAKLSETEFLKTLKSAYELPEIKTGNHQTLDKVTGELEREILNAKVKGIKGVLIVNAHGGNQKVVNFLSRIEKKTCVKIRMDSTICNIEGPHAGTGELSIGKVLGITNPSKIEEHNNLNKYPEIGFVGFQKARDKYPWADQHAREVIKEDVKIDLSLGRKLLQKAISEASKKAQRLKDEVAFPSEKKFGEK